QTADRQRADSRGCAVARVRQPGKGLRVRVRRATIQGFPQHSRGDKDLRRIRAEGGVDCRTNRSNDQWTLLVALYDYGRRDRPRRRRSVRGTYGVRPISQFPGRAPARFIYVGAKDTGGTIDITARSGSPRRGLSEYG